jgi:hypothetical protein
VIDWTSAPMWRRSDSWRVSVTNDLPVARPATGSAHGRSSTVVMPRARTGFHP